MSAPVTLSDLCHFIALRREERGDRILLFGRVTRPEQLSLQESVCFFISVDDDLSARIVELDPVAATAVLSVMSESRHSAIKSDSSFPIYDDYWFGKIHHVLDVTMTWTHKPFTSPDAFEWLTPEGIRTWRTAAPEDYTRADGKIVTGGWDHEHCDICCRRIESSEEPNGYVNDLRYWLCESCFSRYVQPRDLRFVLEGPHDPEAPRTEADDVFDKLTAFIKTRNLAAIGRYLDEGGDINIRNRNGSTPLMTAATEGYPAVLKLLLDRGAGLNDVTPKGAYSALAFSAQGGQENAVEMLLAAGAGVQGPSGFAGGSLLVFVRSGRGGDCPRILELLKEAGAE